MPFPTMHHEGVEHHIPGLAHVVITQSDGPVVRITLDPAYTGDLKDVQQDNGLPPGVLFEGTTRDALVDPVLTQFMEVLDTWDHDHDGVYDAHEIADQIEATLLLGSSPIRPYKRPNRGPLTDLLMRYMPPQPDRHIVLSYGNLQIRMKVRHYLWGIPMLLGVIGLINLQFWLLPWTRYSVVSGIGLLADTFGLIPTIAGLFIVLRVLKLIVGNDGKREASHSKFTYGFFNRAAVDEEQAFREGSENWTTGQRIYACVAFGLIHLGNLIYPLATIVPLSLGGGLFMVEYLRVYRTTRFRRMAVLASSVFHRVYNRIALTVMVVALVTLAFSLTLSGLTAVLGAVGMSFAMDMVNQHLRRPQPSLETV